MVKVGYKETEIGVIPEDWESVKLLSKCKLLNGLTYNPNDIVENGLLVLRSSNIQLNQLTFVDNVYVSIAVDNEKLIKKDDIVICVRNGSSALIGKCAKASKDYPITFGAFMAVLRGDNNDYIFQLLQQGVIQNRIIKNSGATINQITNGDFKTIYIPFPSDSKEQQKIAEALSDMDNLISSLEKLIEKKKAIKQACLQKMFPKEGESVPQTRLPGFSDAWEQRKLGELGTITTGSTPSTSIPDYYSDDGIVWVTPTDICDNITFESARKLSDLGQQVGRVVPKNTILVTCIASIGKNTMLGNTGSFNQQINGLTPNENECDPYFLLTESALWSAKMKSSAAAGTMQIVNRTEFSELKTWLPSLIEQQAISGFFRQLDNLITLHKRKLEKCKKIKEGMMQQLLTGKIRLI